MIVRVSFFPAKGIFCTPWKWPSLSHRPPSPLPFNGQKPDNIGEIE